MGCSALRQEDTQQFYKQESAATKICMSVLSGLTDEQRLKVDPATGRSPWTNVAHCYANQTREVVSTLDYPHAPQVAAFSDFLVNLAEMRDKGFIKSDNALAYWKVAADEFKQSIRSADEKYNYSEARLRELGNQLGIFSAQMAAILVEGAVIAVAIAAATAASRQQYQFSRPVNCAFTGIYKITGLTCS